MLIVRGLSFRFDQEPVLSDISLELRTGECLAVLGPSGCGKSTLLNCIAGFHQPSDGTVELDGTDITHWPAEVRHLGVVFQEYALFPHMSVFENIAFGLRARGQPIGSIKTRVSELIELVGLGGLTERYPAQLSGGQRQRVALARALAPSPKLLLLDEPLTALDRVLRVQLQDELRRLHRVLGLTMIVVTHDPEEAMSLADTILLLRHGRILQAGPTKDLYDQPVSPEAMGFLGRVTEFRGRFVRKAECEITCEVRERKVRIRLPAERGWVAPSPGEEVRLLVRPDRIRLFAQACRQTLEVTHGDDMALLTGRIVDVMEKGGSLEVHLKLNDGGSLVAVVDRAAVEEPLSIDTEVLAAIPTTVIRCFRTK